MFGLAISTALSLVANAAEEKRRYRLLELRAKQLRDGLRNIEDGKYNEIDVPKQEAAPSDWDTWFD